MVEEKESVKKEGNREKGRRTEEAKRGRTEIPVYIGGGRSGYLGGFVGWCYAVETHNNVKFRRRKEEEEEESERE